MRSGTQAIPETRQAPWRRFVTLALCWIASMLVAWVVLVGIDVRLRGPLPGWRTWPYAIEIGLRLAAGSLSVVGALQLASRGLGRRGWMLGPIVAALAVPLLLPMARELSRGEGVVGPRGVVFYGAVVFLCAGVGLACAWHLHAVRAAVGRDSRSQGRRRALLAVGVAAAAALFWATSLKLGAYEFLHALTVPLIVVVAGTAVFTSLARRRPGFGAVLVLVPATAIALAGRFAEPPAVEGRPFVVPRSPMAALVDVWLWSAADVVRLDFDHPERFQCHKSSPRSWPPSPGPSDRPRHVVLVSIDALRSDAVEARSRGRPVMPQLDAFAREAIFAARATTTYPATVFAVGSALTGLSASRILFSPKPPPSVLSLAARRVGDVFAALPSVHWFSQPVVGKLFLQGVPFGRFSNATEQTDAALDRMHASRAAGRSSLVWIHYYEPHEPYQAHAGLVFGDSRPDRYRSEAAFVDRQIARLVEAYRSGGWQSDTLFVVFSDHGEALGERQYWGHHVYLDHWIADVPVVVRAPGLAGRRVESVVELTDVAATIAHFLELPLDSSTSGYSLLMGDPPAGRMAVSEAFPARGNELFRIAGRPIRSAAALAAVAERMQRELRRYSPRVSLVDGGHRLIVDRESGLSSLYDRRSVPRESRDVVTDRPDVLASMTRRLVRWHEQTSEQIYCAVVGHAGNAAAKPSLRPASAKSK